jgi:hypothetical protein
VPLFDRQTAWRQGSWIAPLSNAGVCSEAGDASILVVITHDCDLANDAEPFVEFVRGTQVPKTDGNFERAKNARKLHVTLAAGVSVELAFSERFAKAKADLEQAQPTLAGPCDEAAKAILKQWLAARYGRPAFPNEFEKRIDKVRKKLDGIVSKGELPKTLVGVFVALEDVGELAADQPYVLKMVLVYEDDGDLKKARDAASAAGAIRTLFEDAYGAPGEATAIDLESCDAIHVTKMTLADLRKYDQWRLEHVSFKAGEPVLGPDERL